MFGLECRPVRVVGRAAVVSLLAGAAGTASAEIPSVLSHVPDSTPVYVVMPNVGAMLGDVSAFNQSLAGKLPPEAAQIGMGLFFAQMITTQPGFDTNGSAAIIVDFDPAAMGNMGMNDMGDAPEPEVSVLLPISDLEAFAKGPFLANQGAKFDGDVLVAAMPDGETFYLRDIGDYSIAGLTREGVAAFKAGEFGGAHEKALGQTGAFAMDGSDMVVVANVPLLEGFIGQLVRQAEQQVNFIAMMGGGDAVMNGFATFKNVAEALRRDGSVGLMSVDMSGEGAAVDLGASFREGTSSAEMFQGEAATTPLMGALPQTDFLMAYAFDASSASLKKMVQGAMAFMPQGEGGMGMAGMLDSVTGFSGVIGTSPAALGGAGLLAKQVAYARAEDPSKAVAAMREMVSGMNGTAAMGMNYQTGYQEDAAEVAGQKVDTYQIRTTVDPAAAGGGMMMDPMMMQSMMYGMSGGPSGFVAETENGFITTTSRNSELLASALAAAEGGPSLLANQKLTGVAAKLHQNRFAEAYVSADQIFNSFGPFAQMLGMIEAFEPLPAMSPVGMSMRGDGGGVLLRTYVPSDVIGFAAEFAGKMEAEEMGGGEDEPMEPDF